MQKFAKKINHWKLHIVQFFVPVLFILILYAGLYFALCAETFTKVFTMVSIELFSPFSVEVSAPFGAVAGLSLLHIIAILLFVNVVVGYFITVNIGLIEHIPKIGRFLKKYDKKMCKLIKKHNLEHVSVFGLFLFFLSPLHGSGAVSSAIIGRLLNMSVWKILFVIGLGTIAGVLIFSSPVYILHGVF